MPDHFDIAIIGGGPGGYSAALRAGASNKKTALIEREKIGGLCLHKGCIPSKALISSAEKIHSIESAKNFGIDSEVISFDWGMIQNRKKSVVSKLFSGLQSLIKERNISIFDGEASIRRGSNNKFSVSIKEDGETSYIDANSLIIATGSKEKTMPAFNIDRENIITSDEALELKTIPNNILIVGGGSIGTEFGSLLNAFGCDVTIVETSNHILPFADGEAAVALEKALTKRGIKIHDNVRVEGIRFNGKAVIANLVKDATKFDIAAEKCLVAIGRSPTVPEADFDIGIDENGYIKVDEHMKTNIKNVYAIGDVVRTPGLAHVAFNEGIVAVEDIIDANPQAIDYTGIPWCVYSEPQLAYVGLTENEAIAKGHKTIVKSLGLSGNAMAVIEGETDGLVKFVTDDSGIILGIHLVGHNATELIAAAMLSVNWGADVFDISRLINAHPTVSEGLSEAALFLSGKPLHTPIPRKERRKAA